MKEKNTDTKKYINKESSENWDSKMSDIGEGKKLTETELLELKKKRGY